MLNVRSTNCQTVRNVVTYLLYAIARCTVDEMAITTLTSREFNQDVSKAKRAAQKGPVFVTDRGRVSHVLLSVEDYQAITQEPLSIVEMLAMPEAAEIEFQPARAGDRLYRPADFS